MIEVNNELMCAMRKFKEVFGDIVPLRQLPQSATNEDVIGAINDSIEQNINLLPKRFGYMQLEQEQNTLV